MVRRKLPEIAVGHEELVPRLNALRSELAIPLDFSAEAQAEADNAAAE
ncbi:MAG: hypothetical protein Q4P05_03010 [Actinomycetaceae bacterium]|nr:hypothetical protein [Actinomycetaceae bacterium]